MSSLSRVDRSWPFPRSPAGAGAAPSCARASRLAVVTITCS